MTRRRALPGIRCDRPEQRGTRVWPPGETDENPRADPDSPASEKRALIGSSRSGFPLAHRVLDFFSGVPSWPGSSRVRLVERFSQLCPGF